MVGGKDATGSVWFDDLFLYGWKPDGWDWVGSLFNNSFNAKIASGFNFVKSFSHALYPFITLVSGSSTTHISLLIMTFLVRKFQL